MIAISFVRDTVMDYWANIIDSVVVINEDASVSCRSSFEDLLVKYVSYVLNAFINWTIHLIYHSL